MKSLHRWRFGCQKLPEWQTPPEIEPDAVFCKGRHVRDGVIVRERLALAPAEILVRYRSVAVATIRLSMINQPFQTLRGICPEVRRQCAIASCTCATLHFDPVIRPTVGRRKWAQEWDGHGPSSPEWSGLSRVVLSWRGCIDFAKPVHFAISPVVF